MLKELWEKVLEYAFTSFDIELDFEITYLFIGIVLGFILTTAILVSYI